MIRTKVTLALTKQGKDVLLQKLEDAGYDKRSDKMFADARSFLDSATTLVEKHLLIALEFEELAAGRAELDSLKAALVGLADEMYPYQAMFEDEYGTQYDGYGYGEQADDIVLPGERLDYDIFDEGSKEILADETKRADIALMEVDDDGLDRHDMENLMLVLADKRFEPVTINAETCEWSVMGLISKPAAIALKFDYDNLRDFVAWIFDDPNRESEDGLYEFYGLKLLLRR